MSVEIYVDAVLACMDLVGRAGASGFEIGFIRDDVPIEEAGWYALATYRGTRIMTGEHRSPSTAAMALAERLLRGAACRCGKLVALSDDASGCRWQLMGKEWKPSCEAPSIPVGGERGDYSAITAAYREHVGGER